MKNKKTYKFSKKARKNMSIAQELRRSKEHRFSSSTKVKMSTAQQARYERESLSKPQKTLENRIPVYEGTKLIGYTDELSSVENFIKAMPKRKYTRKLIKIKNTPGGKMVYTDSDLVGYTEFKKYLDNALKMPTITTKKSKTGCFPLIFIAYLLFWAVYGWMNTSEIVEAKIDNISDVKIEEVKSATSDVKIEPELKTEPLEVLFDSTEQDLRNYIELKFAPLGDEAVEWALFTANQESRFMTRPHNMQDDHSAWCNLENGSHGLYHFSTCTYAGLGGTEIMNPYEQIDIVSRPEVYNRRAFYWVYSTNLFESK